MAMFSGIGSSSSAANENRITLKLLTATEGPCVTRFLYICFC